MSLRPGVLLLSAVLTYGCGAPPPTAPQAQAVEIPDAESTATDPDGQESAPTSGSKPSGSKPSGSIPGKATRDDTSSAPEQQPPDDGPSGKQSRLPAPPDVAHPSPGASFTSSGIASLILRAGQGNTPGPNDRVRVHYTGWTKDGTMFDSSVLRGQPASFGVQQLIPGWTEVLQLMVEGEKRRVWIPAALAYGQSPRHRAAPAGQLTFDIELLEVIQIQAPQVPANVSGPPSTATRTPSGLAYQVLTPGQGATHPGPNSRVIVHYSGWTTSGRLFDSSLTRGAPAHFRVSQVIQGWQEALQLMVEGERTRFWIPGDLAYGNTPRGNSPSGMLVFDIELLKIGPAQP